MPSPQASSALVQPSLPPAVPESTPPTSNKLYTRDKTEITRYKRLDAPRVCPNPLCGRPSYSARRKACSLCQTVLPKVVLPKGVKFPDDSKIRKSALHAIAMRIGGSTDDEIAKALGLTVNTIRGYIYRASRNGWLDIDDPKDRIEYQLIQKTVDNLDEALDDQTRHSTSGMEVRTQVALKIAEGTVFKRFDPAPAAVQQNMVLAINIEGAKTQDEVPREGAVGGTPRFIDADVVSKE